ncbi:DUF5686 and carboxypeptidase-like regulatory domain-containing protein [Mucilaginibacter koreensis]
MIIFNTQPRLRPAAYLTHFIEYVNSLFQNNTSTFLKTLFICLSIFVSAISASAQQTIVTGMVTDAGNRQPLPYVTVVFQGSSNGTNTNETGRYALRSTTPYSSVKVSFVGYKTAVLAITPGKEQVLNIRLQPDNRQLGEVVVKAGKKKKYTNKDNPAVELIRQVIAHKNENRPEHYNFLEYKEYDRMILSLENVSPTISDKKFFRKYKFLLDNRDTTSAPGKSLLPVYINEKLSQNYIRKSPDKNKTILLGQKDVNYGGLIDNEGVTTYFKHLYREVDLYENNIVLVTNPFLSPIADGAPTFYKFFITDTIVVNNSKVVELSFTPRNTNSMLFEGTIYITLDGHYAVQRASLYVNPRINLNWVKSLRINQDYALSTDGRYHVSRTDMLADFGVNKNKAGGVFGERTVSYSDYVINTPRPEATYNGLAEVEADNYKNRDDAFWQQNRLDTLNASQAKVYGNIDSLQKMPSYKRIVFFGNLLLAGYTTFKKFEIGPANTFYSFNPVEGFRLRLGGRTTPGLSTRYYFETYGAYGFKDEKWKFFFSGTYSLNNKSIYKFPQNYIRGSFQRDIRIPGQDLQFVQEDNFLLSFKRGNNNKYLYNDYYRLDYVHEFENHFSYALGLRKWTQTPAGDLTFENRVNGQQNFVNDLTTSQISLQLRYAPHEQFYQGRIYRTPFLNKYPKFTLNITQGLNNVLESKYSYTNVNLNIYKHVYLSQLGFADVTLDGGKIFGQVPYPLLTIHRANQTYAYSIESYNLMNFLEFVSDRYASINIDQHFNGFIFNRIPLFRRLKWRETATFKGLWGGLSDRNNPDIHPSLYRLPMQPDGTPITYTLGSKPYAEGSVGIENIFKVLRVDLVRRFTYLDHPDAPKWGVRARVQFVF